MKEQNTKKAQERKKNYKMMLNKCVPLSATKTSLRNCLQIQQTYVKDSYVDISENLKRKHFYMM